MVAKKEKSLSKYSIWLEENRTNPKLHTQKSDICFPDPEHGKLDSTSLAFSFAWGLRIQVLILTQVLQNQNEIFP